MVVVIAAVAVAVAVACAAVVIVVTIVVIAVLFGIHSSELSQDVAFVACRSKHVNRERHRQIHAHAHLQLKHHLIRAFHLTTRVSISDSKCCLLYHSNLPVFPW